jgi:hypothetical protein
MAALADKFQCAGEAGVVWTIAIYKQLVEGPPRTFALPNDPLCLQPDHAVPDKRVRSQPPDTHVSDGPAFAHLLRWRRLAT